MDRSVLATALLVVLLPTVVLAQDKEAEADASKLASWAPAWKLGDWWVVRTFQKDLTNRLRSPKPVKGGLPRVPPNPRAEPLPGFPPLRNGVPVGYKAGNRFRLEVVRKEQVKHEDDRPGTPPEEFWIVSLKSLEGPEARTAELWYSADDLVLSRVVLHPAGKKRTFDLVGSAQLHLGVSATLGFPLDWPDLKAAAKPLETLILPDRFRAEQRTKTLAKGTDDEHVQLELTQEKPRRGTARAEGLFTWKKDRPFWTRLQTGTLLGQLEEHGRKEE